MIANKYQRHQQQKSLTVLTIPLLNSIFMHFFRLLISFIGSFTISAGGLFLFPFDFALCILLMGKSNQWVDIYVFASPKCACPSFSPRIWSNFDKNKNKEKKANRTTSKKEKFPISFRCGELRFFGCLYIYFHFYCLTTHSYYLSLNKQTIHVLFWSCCCRLLIICKRKREEKPKKREKRHGKWNEHHQNLLLSSIYGVECVFCFVFNAEICLTELSLIYLALYWPRWWVWKPHFHAV